MAKRKIPKVLNEEEEQKLLDQFNKRYISAHRNYVLIKTFLDLGLRLEEARNLKWDHFSRDLSGDLRLKVVNGKGGKQRTLWPNDELTEELEEWKERQQEEIGECEHVFTTTRKPGPNDDYERGQQLGRNYIQQMVYKYADKAGIQKEEGEAVEYERKNPKTGEVEKIVQQPRKVSPHTLRHTFATKFYRETKDLRALQQVLGHADISTTMIYTHLVNDEAKEGMKKLGKKAV